MMPSPAELAANLLNTASILLAGRNRVHTWWTGILGCAAFAWVFYHTQLYADAVLQLFFIGTSVWGWWRWARGGSAHTPLPVRRCPPRVLVALSVAGVVVTAGYAWLLHRFTDAYAPVPDTVVLVASVIAQLLLTQRRVETWPAWLLVNTVAVPLYASRGLWLTAVLYAGYWVNALIAWRHWRRLAASTPGPQAVSA